jgi:hypothetical protein
MIIYVIVFIIICIIFILIIYFTTSRKKQYNCACVFDLDNTITCNISNAKKAVDECSSRSCLFAINTARTQSYYKDIEIDNLGIPHSAFINDFYHGDWDKNNFSYANKEELMSYIAKTKVKNLDIISKKYGIPKKSIILFDDNTTNIDSAKYNGYSTILADHSNCGLKQNVDKEISDILDESY